MWHMYGTAHVACTRNTCKLCMSLECVLCRCLQWVQMTGIYSAGRQTLEMKLDHILQDSLSCHLCSYPAPFPHPDPDPYPLCLSQARHVELGVVLQTSKECLLHSPWV